MRRLKNLSLTAKFFIYSLLATLIVGLISSYFMNTLVRDHIFREFVHRSLTTQKTLVSTNLNENDFRRGSSRLTDRDFDNFIKSNIISDDIVRIKIWRGDGTLLYSDERRLIGRRFKKNEEFQTVKSGKLLYEVTGLESEENKYERIKFNSLLEIYSPIEYEGKVVGLYETYFSMKPVAAAEKQATGLVTLFFTGSLGLLWLFLTGIVRSASATIQQQNDELRLFSTRLFFSIKQLQENYLGTMASLATAVGASDRYTADHAKRTGRPSERRLKFYRRLNLTKEQQNRIERAAALHDIGKIGTPESILIKPGSLSPSEWKRMQEHVAVGTHIVGSIPFLKDIAPIILQHHEHYDGSGYPNKLAKDQILLEARILAVIDAYDAMTTDRPYRRALSREEALKEFVKGKNAQFDPVVVDAFVEVYQK